MRGTVFDQVERVIISLDDYQVEGQDSDTKNHLELVNAHDNNARTDSTRLPIYTGDD